MCARRPTIESPPTSIQDGQAKRVARRGEQHGPQEDTRPRVPFKPTGLSDGLPALRHVSSMIGFNCCRTGAQTGSPACMGGTGVSPIHRDSSRVGGGKHGVYLSAAHAESPMDQTLLCPLTFPSCGLRKQHPSPGEGLQAGTYICVNGILRL